MKQGKVVTSEALLTSHARNYDLVLSGSDKLETMNGSVKSPVGGIKA